MASTDLTDFRNQFLARAKTDLLAVDLSAATTNTLLIKSALLRGYDSVNRFDAIGLDAIYPITQMTGAELDAYLGDPSNRQSFETLLNSAEARIALVNSNAALTTIGGSLIAMQAVLAHSAAATLMTAIAASSTAMTALIANSTAWATVVASSAAMTAIAASSTAMTEVAASSTAMTAVAASATAMNAIIASSTAMTAVFANSTAKTTFKASTALTVKTIPAMTSNTAPSGVASASSIVSADYDAWKACDGTTGYWLTPSGVTTNSWVEYDFSLPVYIHTAELKNHGTYPAKDFRIECSSDDANWITALTGTQANNTTLQIRDVVNAGKYRYWRVFCINNHSGTYLAMDVMQLRGFA